MEWVASLFILIAVSMAIAVVVVILYGLGWCGWQIAKAATKFIVRSLNGRKK